MTCWKSNRMAVFCGQVTAASDGFVASSTLCDGQNFLSLCCGISAEKCIYGMRGGGGPESVSPSH